MAVKKTPEAAAAKPARSRKVAEPEPAVEVAPAKDRTMFWALAFLAAAVVFGGGYLVGHAAADDDQSEFEGRGAIVMSDGSVMHPGDMPGMPGMDPMYQGGMIQVMPGMPGMDPMYQGGMGQVMPGMPGMGRHGCGHMSGMPGMPYDPTSSYYPFPYDPYDPACSSCIFPGGTTEAIPVPDDSGIVVDATGWLGIAGEDRPGAVTVVEVVPGSPAEAAGIKADDRILSYGGEDVSSMEQLARLVATTTPGTEVEMMLGGPEGARSVIVIIGERPADQ